MVIFNALQTSLSGGIGRYSYELSKAIYKLKKIDFKIAIREEDRESFQFADEQDLIIVKGIKNSKDRNYYEQFVLPLEISKKHPGAVLHYPDSMAPVIAKNPVVITIHDLAFLSRPQDFTKKTTLWKKAITKLSVKKASGIISITEFARTEIEKFYKNEAYKAHTVYNGFNDFSKENIDNSKISEIVNLAASKPYIFTVSTISPRKNIDGLIKAFYNIKDQIDYNLVISGGKGWLYEGVFKLVNELKLQDRVIFTGKINDEELKYLYKNAEIFIYPSFYEGFGLPPLEAMSFGTPCIASGVTSIPEVLEESALYINPSNIENISEQLLKLSSSSDLKQDLIRKGYDQINKFSWEKCAKETIDLYLKVK